MFQVVYVAGGTIDKVRELPYPHFSKYPVPLVKGRSIDVTASPVTFTDSYSMPFPAEFLSVAFAASEYCIGDFWELTVGDKKVCETIYTKALPESVSMGNSFGIVYPIPADTIVKFEFQNVSGVAKQVWYNVKYLVQ